MTLEIRGLKIIKSSRLLLIVLALGAFLLIESAAASIPDPLTEHHIPFGKDYSVVEPVAKFGGKIVGYPLQKIGYVTGRFMVDPVVSIIQGSESDTGAFAGHMFGGALGAGIGQWLFGAPTFLGRTVFVDLPWYLVSAEKRAKKSISLSGPGVDKKLSEWGDKKYLKELSLRRTDVTDEGLKHLKSMESLEVLYLQRTDITGTGLKHLKILANLRRIYLDHTKVADENLKHINEFKNLETLSLPDTEISNDGLKHLKGLKNLRDLDIDNTHITDSGVEHFRGLTNLRDLDLENTNITDAGIEHIKGLKNLRYLDLESTDITDEGIKELKDALPDVSVYR